MSQGTSLSHDANSDVNVHKTNLFFRANFQFISISNRNEMFYAYFIVIEMKIKTVSFKNGKKITKSERNETFFGS
jgi:hypothetical protein